jgi:hypothetical protein
MLEMERLQKSNEIIKELRDDRLITNREYFSIKKDNDIEILKLAYKLGFVKENAFLDSISMIERIWNKLEEVK